jgi:hypothetical protein
MSAIVALLIGGEARTCKTTFKRHDTVTGALATEAALRWITIETRPGHFPI